MMVPMIINRLEVTDNVMKKNKMEKERIFTSLDHQKASPMVVTIRKSEYINPAVKKVLETGIWLKE
jgi:hypothetical protein